MKKLLIACAMSVGAVLVALTLTILPASADTCVATPCPITLPQGNLQTSGTIEQPLEFVVEVCYPAEDWGSQLMREGQAPFYVSLNVVGESGVQSGIPRYQTREDMTDAKLIRKQCYNQHYAPGWVIMATTKCRREGFNIFLTTKVLTADDNGTRVYFEGRPDLDRYAYPVRR